VKHFKWTPRGKRRLHSRPNRSEVSACHPWLVDEIAVVKPEVIVCMGATAAQSLLGPTFRVTVSRGVPLRTYSAAPVVVATVHPSSILRMRDEAEREHELRRFVADLVVAAAQTRPRKSSR
jgi:uracil-DNA glycosylase family 4